MLVLLVNKLGEVIGNQHIENAFYRKQDLCINNKAIKIRAIGEINGIVLLTTNDEEFRLLGDRRQIFVTAYPKSFRDICFNLGNNFKLFAIDSLKIDAGGYLKPMADTTQDTWNNKLPTTDKS